MKTTRPQRIKKSQKLLAFHKTLAMQLALGRRCGSKVTTTFWRARLLVNAQVLRHRILENYQTPEFVKE